MQVFKGHKIEKTEDVGSANCFIFDKKTTFIAIVVFAFEAEQKH